MFQAFQTLSLVGNADIIPWIEPLLDDPDSEISGPAKETIYFVSERDDDDPDPDYGADTRWGSESERDPAPDSSFEFNSGLAGGSEESLRGRAPGCARPRLVLRQKPIGGRLVLDRCRHFDEHIVAGVCTALGLSGAGIARLLGL